MPVGKHAAERSRYPNRTVNNVMNYSNRAVMHAKLGYTTKKFEIWLDYEQNIKKNRQEKKNCWKEK